MPVQPAATTTRNVGGAVRDDRDTQRREDPFVGRIAEIIEEFKAEIDKSQDTERVRLLKVAIEQLEAYRALGN